MLVSFVSTLAILYQTLSPAQAERRPVPLALKQKVLKIVGISAVDDGSLDSGSSGSSIDVLQGICNPSGSASEAEPFHDSVLRISIKNTTGSFVRLKQFSYSIGNSDGAGTVFNSAPLALVGGGYVDTADEPTDVLALFLYARDGRKVFTRSPLPIRTDLGFRNVTVRLTGVTAARRKVRLVSRVTLSFGNFDRCDD